MIFAAIAEGAEQKQFPVEFMCRELGVSVAGYYARRKRPACPRAKTDAALTSLIRQIWGRLSGNPGVRRIHAELAAMGRVWRLMRATGLQGRQPRAWRKTTIHGDAPVGARAGHGVRDPAKQLFRRLLAEPSSGFQYCAGGGHCPAL